MTKDKSEMDEPINLEQAADYARVPLRTVQRAAAVGYLDTLDLPTRDKLTTRRYVDQWLKSPFKRASRQKSD